MREILFRGKKVDNGEWIVGYFCTFLKHKEYRTAIQICNNRNKLKHLKAFEVIPKTVGEYTNVKDKFFRQIFEGDICEYTRYKFDGTEEKFICTVEYFRGCYYLADPKDKNICISDLDIISMIDIEIIGNIHDNPELLN